MQRDGKQAKYSLPPSGQAHLAHTHARSLRGACAECGAQLVPWALQCTPVFHKGLTWPHGAQLVPWALLGLHGPYEVLRGLVWPLKAL